MTDARSFVTGGIRIPGTPHTDRYGNAAPTSLAEWQAGQIPGYRAVEVRGLVVGVDGTEATMIPLAVPDKPTLPSASFTIAVASSSANDDAAGTGARTIRVWYIDANGVRDSVDVEMDGTTKVTTAATALWVEMFEVLTVGSTGDIAGFIHVGDDADTWTSGKPNEPYACGRTGFNAGFSAGYQCPADRAAFIGACFQTAGQTSSQQTTLSCHGYADGSAVQVLRQQFFLQGAGAQLTFNESIFGPLAEGERFIARANRSGGTGTVTARFRCLVFEAPTVRL